MNCHYCNQEITSKNWIYCPFCGENLGETTYFEHTRDLEEIIEFIKPAQSFHLLSYERGHRNIRIEIGFSRKVSKAKNVNIAHLKCLFPEYIQGPIDTREQIVISQVENGFIVTSKSGLYITCRELILYFATNKGKS